MKLEQALRAAKKKVKEGALDEALQLYGHILKKFPNNKKAKKNFDNISRSTKKKNMSIQEPPIQNLRSLFELHAQGDYDSALKSSLNLLKAFPNSPTLHNFNGVIYAALEEYEAALNSYMNVIKYSPENLEAHFNIGIVLKQLGRPTAAIERFKHVIKFKPNDVAAQASLASVLLDIEKFEDAIFHYDEALKADPFNTKILFNLGNALVRKGDIAGAIARYKQVLDIEPDNAEVYNNMGDAYKIRDEPDQSLKCYQNAIRIKPNYAAAHYNCGIITEQNGNVLEAIKSYEKSIKIIPDWSAPYNRAGCAFQALGDFDSAIRYFQKCLSMTPLNSEAHNNLGFCLSVKGDSEGAITSYRQAIEIAPEYADAYHNLSIELLANENFRQGFSLNEWRWKRTKTAQSFLVSSKPIWNGHDSGALFVWKEQGIGDQIMFASIIPELHQRCSKLIVQCDDRLIPLFERSFPSDIVYQSAGSVVDESLYDFHLPIGSLPRFFRNSGENFSKTSNGYLFHDNNRSSLLRSKILTGKKKRLIGISWMTVSPILHAKQRNVDLMELVQALDSPEIQLVSLQYGDVFDQIERLNAEFGYSIIKTSEIDNSNDIEGLASLIMACDQIVSTTNVTVHLAGALGANVVALLPKSARWIWGRKQSYCRWYSGVLPYSQNVTGDWTNVLAKVSKDLKPNGISF
jgi:tetratricopeptide (TPR) repeat protein